MTSALHIDTHIENKEKREEGKKLNNKYAKRIKRIKQINSR